MRRLRITAEAAKSIVIEIEDEDEVGGVEAVGLAADVSLSGADVPIFGFTVPIDPNEDRT